MLLFLATSPPVVHTSIPQSPPTSIASRWWKRDREREGQTGRGREREGERGAAYMHGWMRVDLCPPVCASTAVCIFCMWCRKSVTGENKWRWVWGGGGGVCFVGSGRPRSVVCHTIQGFNAGVIKEQLQGCMDTRQSKPNEVSIGRIGAHAWTKASWHSFREGPLQGEQTHTHTHTASTHTNSNSAHITKAGWWQYKRLGGTQF